MNTHFLGMNDGVIVMVRGRRLCMISFLALFITAAPLFASPPKAGPAEARIIENELQLSSGDLCFTWRAAEAGVELVRIEDRRIGAIYSIGAPTFRCERGQESSPHQVTWEMTSKPKIAALSPEPGASRRAEQFPGTSIGVEFHSSDGLQCAWRAEIRTGSHYVRQWVTLRSTKHSFDLARVILVDAVLSSARVCGDCPGSPIVAGDLFMGVEHPMARSRVSNGRAESWISRALPLRQGQPVTYSSVMGVAPRGQMRRAFLAYVERERAHPYRPFLHYNSWYDLGMFTQFDEEKCLDVIRAYGRELVDKRGVKIDSFLFDDGWDEYESMWRFHKGFPRGFVPLKAEAAKIESAPGVWLSPWGGYGDPRKRRLAYGKANGYEVDDQGYALSGPRYYARFHEVTLEFVTKHGINHFKFDGTGSADKTHPGSAFDSDFEAAIQLIADLRNAKPDLFINLTTGTWPSPFWLRHADSTWRGGSDHSFAGVGSDRQRWITYRDADTYSGVVKKAPLYPLNSLMLHGIIYAPHAYKLSSDSQGDFQSEARSYFGSGTQLQELYVSPALLTKENWDDLAEAAKWSRGNADILVDTHWVGGDPGKLEVYGWAAWSPRMGILVLRNPSDRAQAFSVDPQLVFELPDQAIKSFTARCAYRSDEDKEKFEFAEGRSRVLDLAGFEVRVLEFSPRGS